MLNSATPGFFGCRDAIGSLRAPRRPAFPRLGIPAIPGSNAGPYARTPALRLCQRHLSPWRTIGTIRQFSGLIRTISAVIIPLDRYHVPRSLKKVMRQKRFEIRVDTAFEAVIVACAECRPDRPRTWLNDQLIALYCTLHEQHYAHSVECWVDDRLVGRRLWSLARRRLFRGKHVHPGARRQQGSAGRSDRAFASGRLSSARHPIRHRSPHALWRHPDSTNGLSTAAKGSARRRSSVLFGWGVIVSSTPWRLKSGSVGSSQSTTQTS